MTETYEGDHNLKSADVIQMDRQAYDPSKTQIIFIQDRFFLGGIEILELKLIEQLSRLGFQLTVAARDNELLDISNGTYRWFVHIGYPDLISRAASLVAKDVETIIFVSLHPTAAIASEILGSAIRNQYGRKVSVHHFHWVNHSRAFFFSENKMVKMLFRRFFFLLPKKSTYFMNGAALDAHQTYWQKSLIDYHVLRIVGREPTSHFLFNKKSEGNELNFARANLRIVSVGRLVAFKSYNMHAAMVTRQLRDAGIDATWDIWGYGPDENAILSTFSKFGVLKQVRLCGPLPHTSLDETVISYDVFVGMGTAVLEAAKAGMPVVVGVENRSDSCYGHLHEAPIDSVGDRVEGFPERTLYEVLSAFSALDSNERQKMGELGAAAAHRRESNIDDFVAAILAAEQISGRRFARRILLLVGTAYLFAAYWKRERTKG